MKGIKLKNYSNYWIFPELGKVWSIKRIGRNNHFVKGGWIGTKNKKNGYWYVTMTDDNGKQKNFRLHRLIWTSVYGEIPKGYEINHTTENLDINMISCLSLVTPKQNANYGTRNKRLADNHNYIEIAEKLSKMVGMYDLNGNLKQIFPSTAEAARQLGYYQGNISRCCLGKRETYKKHIWRYVA